MASFEPIRWRNTDSSTRAQEENDMNMCKKKGRGVEVEEEEEAERGGREGQKWMLVGGGERGAAENRIGSRRKRKKK